MSNAIKSGAADELIYQIETNNMQWTTNDNIDLSNISLLSDAMLVAECPLMTGSC